MAFSKARRGFWEQGVLQERRLRLVGYATQGRESLAAPSVAQVCAASLLCDSDSCDIMQGLLSAPGYREAVSGMLARLPKVKSVSLCV
jgi:hypothetical protein